MKPKKKPTPSIWTDKDGPYFITSDKARVYFRPGVNVPELAQRFEQRSSAGDYSYLHKMDLHHARKSNKRNDSN